MDIKLFHQICLAVMSGHCSVELASRLIGPYNGSRWVTFAARILMYYMTLWNPPQPIKRLANFALKHYATQLFSLRLRWRVTEAAAVLFEGWWVGQLANRFGLLNPNLQLFLNQFILRLQTPRRPSGVGEKGRSSGHRTRLFLETSGKLIPCLPRQPGRCCEGDCRRENPLNPKQQHRRIHR